MISGHEMGHARALALALLVVVALPAAAQPPTAEAPRWGLPQLMASLQQVKSASGQFVERKTLRVLNQPLIASGTLLYVAPDQVQKITVSPQRERLALSGDMLTVEGGPDDRTRTMSLASNPEVAAFVEGIRATLAGDLPALERFYTVQFAGGPTSWQIELQPRDERLRKLVQWIRIGGSGDLIRAVNTEQGDGDHSEMSIVEDIHDAH
jgi:Outer membrane lipoprotein carrier protein LolA-like